MDKQTYSPAALANRTKLLIKLLLTNKAYFINIYEMRNIQLSFIVSCYGARRGRPVKASHLRAPGSRRASMFSRVVKLHSRAVLLLSSCKSSR